MAKYCTNCGEKVDDNISFCPECGQKFSMNTAQPDANSQPMDYSQPGQYAQPGQPVPPMQPNPAQPTAYQNGYNPYGQQPNGYPPNNYQQNAYQNPNYQGNGYQSAPGAGIEALKWTSYNGRLNRKRYFLRGLVLGFSGFFIAFVVAFVAVIMGMHEDTAAKIGYVACLPLVVLSLFNSIKRLHDLDKPEWPVIIALLPAVFLFVDAKYPVMEGVINLVNVAFSIYLLFFKGTNGPNQYGDDPLRF